MRHLPAFSIKLFVNTCGWGWTPGAARGYPGFCVRATHCQGGQRKLGTIGKPEHLFGQDWETVSGNNVLTGSKQRPRAVLAVGCSGMTADEEAIVRQSFGVPADMPIRDRGVVELRAAVDGWALVVRVESLQS